MTSTPVCPSCKARLRLKNHLPAGASLKCPKCAKTFRLPDETDAEEREELDEQEAPRKPRQASVSKPSKSPGKKVVRPKDEEDADDDEEDMEDRKPKRRSRDDDDDEETPSRKKKGKGKKQKAGGKGLYVLLGVGGAVVAAGVVVLVLILNSGGDDKAGKGLPGRDKAGSKEKEPEMPPHPATARLAGPADVTLTADELGSQMRDVNAVKEAQAKYKGKVISLSGVVLGVSKASFALDVKGVSMIEVASTEPRPWEKLLPGQSVKVNVMFWERDPGGDIGLVGGPIKDVTGTPRPIITAEAFGQEFQADPKAAEKKYQSRPHQVLYMTGEVQEVHSERDLPGFVLKTGTAYRVKCFTEIGGDRDLKVGQRIRMIGSFFAPAVENPMDLRVPGTWVFPSGK